MEGCQIENSRLGMCAMEVARLMNAAEKPYYPGYIHAALRGFSLAKPT
jgi:hypothetical protein